MGQLDPEPVSQQRPASACLWPLWPLVIRAAGWSAEQSAAVLLGREPVFAADGSVTLILNSNQHNDSLPIGPGFSHRAISMATAPAADGPYKLSSGPIYKPPGYGAEVGDWIGNEDPCIFKQCLPGSESDCGWHILTHQFGPVSCQDIAGIWVAFFSRCQRYRC